MIEKIIIAGSGGQGVMLLGKILTQAAMQEDKFVTWLPAYGAEVRGGTAHCMVTISDAEIGSPYIGQADGLIVLNELSLVKFRPRLKKSGLLVANSSLIKQVGEKSGKVIKYPFTDLAIGLGNIKVANMIALGSFLARKSIVAAKTILNTIEEIAPSDKKDLVEINQKAFTQGSELERRKK